MDRQPAHPIAMGSERAGAHMSKTTATTVTTLTGFVATELCQTSHILACTILRHHFVHMNVRGMRRCRLWATAASTGHSKTGAWRGDTESVSASCRDHLNYEGWANKLQLGRRLCARQTHSSISTVTDRDASSDRCQQYSVGLSRSRAAPKNWR